MPVGDVGPARSAGDAIQQFIEQLQPAISAIAAGPSTVLIRSGYDRRMGTELLTLANGDPIPLRGAGGRTRVALATRLHCRVAETRAPKRASVILAAYSYKFEEPAQPSRELLRFDWHPHVSADIPFPHAHVPAPADGGMVVSGKTHIPTPFLTLADVFQFAIHEFGVPLPTGEPWTRQLQAAHLAMRAAFPAEVQVR